VGTPHSEKEYQTGRCSKGVSVWKTKPGTVGRGGKLYSSL